MGKKIQISVDVPILVYHRIVDDANQKLHSNLDVSLLQFDSQMHYLHDCGYHSVGLSEVLRLPSAPPSRKEKLFAITFDDGYEDFYTCAYPVLHHYGFTATVFLIAAGLHANNRSDQILGLDLQLLNEKQIHELSEKGFSFGSHTMTHQRLLRISSSQVEQELHDSKQFLEDRLGFEVPFLAYPYGESSPAIWKSAMQAGYKAAFGVITGDQGLFNIWRRPCRRQDTSYIFRLKMSRFYAYFLELRKWAREDTHFGGYLRKVKRQRLTAKY